MQLANIGAFSRSAILGSAVLLFAGVQARGTYILTPQQTGTGASSANVAPGGSISLDFPLTSNASDVHNSAIFQVAFSAPGLTESTYVWNSPYTTGTTDDDSTPNTAAKGGGRAQTPTTITAATLSGSAVDIEFSNVLDDGTFGTGNLVTLTLQVPANWSGPNSVTITAVPDTFANGFSNVDASAGPAFTLNIPEPSSLAASVAAAGMLLARRRGRIA